MFGRARVNRVQLPFSSFKKKQISLPPSRKVDDHDGVHGRYSYGIEAAEIRGRGECGRPPVSPHLVMQCHTITCILRGDKANTMVTGPRESLHHVEVVNSPPPHPALSTSLPNPPPAVAAVAVTTAVAYKELWFSLLIVTPSPPPRPPFPPPSHPADNFATKNYTYTCT